MSGPGRAPADWIWVLVGCALLAVAVGVVAGVEPVEFDWSQVRQRLQEEIARLGAWGPLATIGLNVLQVLLAPIPGQFVGVMNGYLYGLVLGTIYTTLGLAIGTALAMAVARRFGRPAVERFVPNRLLHRWDRLTTGRGPLFFFLIFLFPFLPDDLTSFLVGLSPLSIPRMVALATLGRVPGVFISCWVGARASSLPWWSWLPLGGAAGALAWLLWRFQGKLEELVLRLIHTIIGERAGGEE